MADDWWDKTKKYFNDKAEDWGATHDFNRPAESGKSSAEEQGAFFDPSDLAASKKNHVIEFYHIPSKRGVIFKAWVTTFEDSFQSEWTSESVYGRMDPIQTFSGTKRTINLSWNVVAASEQEAIDNMNKCSNLFKMLYPTYAGTSLAAPPLIKLKFLNLIQDSSKASSIGGSSASLAGLTGTVSGFAYTPDMDHGVFDVGIGAIYPKTISLNCSFTSLHSHQMGFSTEVGTSGDDQNAAAKWERFPYNAGRGMAKSNLNQKGSSSANTQASRREQEKAGKKTEG